MFVFIFQFLDYQQGDENILLENTSISTDFFDFPNTLFNKNLLKITNLLGQKTSEKYNKPLLYIYDDGSVEKKVIVK